MCYHCMVTEKSTQTQHKNQNLTAYVLWNGTSHWPVQANFSTSDKVEDTHLHGLSIPLASDWLGNIS
jgi:hypothetical protein